jgi:hypothetical protein
MASEEQIRANKENAKLSHGPVTPEGKAICSKNAIKHALTGATVLLPGDDIEAYNKLVSITFDRFRPVTDAEKLIIQTVADIEWRLLRIPACEADAFARRGWRENENVLNHAEPEDRPLVRQGDIEHSYTKTLSNLALIESRLQRRYEKKIAEFEALRAEREIVELAERKIAMESILGDPKDMSPAHPSVGTVFSLHFLTARVAFIKAVGDKNVAVFDRTWGDKMAKTPN